MVILVNALGIVDSGGINVLRNTLEEFCDAKTNRYYLICNSNISTLSLAKNYKGLVHFNFIFLKNGLLRRFYYEFVLFYFLYKKHKVDLIYNFSGSSQSFLFFSPPQVLKIQNLLFYSKTLDSFYWNKNKYLLWVKQIFLKRMIFMYMLKKAKYIEIQSNHVKECVSDFTKISDKNFYVKSDIKVDISSFREPVSYDFNSKIIFLYIVGPHFQSLHKNFIEFVDAMNDLISSGIDIEINVTLTRDQLMKFDSWNATLDLVTNYYGYIEDDKKIRNLFCDNTILISTSVIETLGLHVIEGIKNGVITIVPDEPYSSSVYGDNVFKYELFKKRSLYYQILKVINYEESYDNKILIIQENLRRNELAKYNKILDVFEEVLNVQK
jgi:hypothetical protein